MLHRVSLAVLLLLLTSEAGCASLGPLSDLRPQALRDAPIRAEDEIRGKAVLARAAAAHGASGWREHRTWAVVLEDRWSDAPLVRRRTPWPDGATWLELQFAPGTSDGRVIFLDGPVQGTIWGRAEERTYAQVPGGPIVWDEADAMASRLPTMQFLYEFPQHIIEAPFVAYVGPREFEGRTAEVVFASWGSVAPHPKDDQFLVYVDAETDHILAMEYTVRKSGRTLLGHRIWRDIRDVDGVVVPFLQTSLRSFEGGDPIHSFFVRSLAFDTVDREILVHPGE